MDFLNLTQEQWQQIAISAGILAGALILGRPLLTFILDRIISRILKATRTTLDNLVVASVRPPLYWLIVLIALEASLDRLDFLTASIQDDINTVTYLLYGLLILTAVWRMINAISEWYLTEIAEHTETPLDNQMVPFVRRIILIIVVVIAAIIILGHFDIEISGLVATLGIGSLAVALAAQATLSDTISGFVIMIDRPYRIGDRIELAGYRHLG